jgi:MFS transporter, MHS family, proline/betaine transporter
MRNRTGLVHRRTGASLPKSTSSASQMAESSVIWGMSVKMRRVVIAGMIGNGLEWYDFALYGYFAPTLGKLFFPGSDPYVQLISAYDIFATGFLVRPVGGLLFGTLGDKYDRKFTLTLSLLMMAIPTACIGLLPTYTSVVYGRPCCLRVCE